MICRARDWNSAVTENFSDNHWTGLRLALAGLVTGAVAALILTRLLSSFSPLLIEVRTDDP